MSSSFVARFVASTFPDDVRRRLPCNFRGSPGTLYLMPSESQEHTPALDDALERVAPGLLRYCFARSNGNWQLAEDVSQECLTALVTRWRSLGPPDSPEAFCFGIARRRVARSLRRRSLLRPLDVIAERATDERSDPEEQLSREQDALQRIRQLESLPRRDREALLLVVAGGLDLETAADTLGTTTGALKTRLHRARKKLRREHDRVTRLTPERSTE